MSDAVAIAMIAAIPTTIVGIVGAYFSYKSAAIGKTNNALGQKIAEQTNGLNAKMVALTDLEAHARGVKEGKEGKQIG